MNKSIGLLLVISDSEDYPIPDVKSDEHKKYYVSWNRITDIKEDFKKISKAMEMTFDLLLKHDFK